ncbi:MAG: flotillin family protein [Myxococcales bacterium]|nr:flotillin family protein [Myxococcales bacterium]
MSPIAVLVLVLGVAAASIILVIKNLLHVCPPNKVLIFSGSHNAVEIMNHDGERRRKVVGYRLVYAGRALRRPLIERVDDLELTNMVIPLAIKNAYSKGGIPLHLEAVANVKVSSTEPMIHNAVERLLGKSRAQIMQIAKETLEGNLRGVLATMTPEEVNEDKISFQKNLVGEAAKDLRDLGLNLDTLNIQNISDERGYLDSIGRKQSAEIQKRAMVAEAETKATSTIRSAENQRDVELARIQASMDMAKAEANRRIIDAETRRDAVIAEQQSEVASAMAKATAELAVQNARIEQIRRQLEADVIEPAKASLKAAIEDAIGDAAKIVEDGAATARALQAVTQTWSKAGENARDIFLLQKVDVLMQLVLETIHNVRIDQVTLLPAGSSTSGGDTPLATRLVSASEQLKAALGVDVAKILQATAIDTSKKDGAVPYGG